MPHGDEARPATNRDPRYFQIAALGALLAYGLAVLGFDQTLGHIALILGSALATQWAGQRLVTPGKPFDPLSPLITALSLSLLLRASGPAWLALAAGLAIGSKFAFRVAGKHIFNPANFGISVLLICGECAWISPSQWGSATWAAFAFSSLAVLVLSKAKRADTALAFLATYLAILFARAIYLGDPFAIPLKQMQSGALLLFAFFMITDPKTTPDRRDARLAFAACVACLGAWLQFGWYRPDGMMLALFFASPLVPLIDRSTRREAGAARFQWSNPVLN